MCGRGHASLRQQQCALAGLHGCAFLPRSSFGGSGLACWTWTSPAQLSPMLPCGFRYLAPIRGWRATMGARAAGGAVVATQAAGGVTLRCRLRCASSETVHVCAAWHASGFHASFPRSSPCSKRKSLTPFSISFFSLALLVGRRPAALGYFLVHLAGTLLGAAFHSCAAGVVTSGAGGLQ